MHEQGNESVATVHTTVLNLHSMGCDFAKPDTMR